MFCSYTGCIKPPGSPPTNSTPKNSVTLLSNLKNAPRGGFQGVGVVSWKVSKEEGGCLIQHVKGI